MIGYTNSTAIKPMPGEYINVRLQTNQSSHDDLTGVVFTVSWDGYSKDYTWNGSDVTILVPDTQQYTVSFKEVTGYKTPSSVTYTAVAENSRDIEAVYQTEVVTVSVSADDGKGISPTITIDGTSYTGSTATKKIPYGKSYQVVFGALSGYTSPSALSYTADSPSREVTGVYKASTLTVNILSNQSNDTVIGAVRATVSYGSTSVQVANGGKVNVPNGAVTITFPAVDGYKTPDAITYTHTGGNIEKSGTYNTEIVRVTLSASNGASVSGQKVTINGVTHTYGSAAVEQKVAFGTNYTVSVNEMNGFTTPKSQSFTAGQSVRNLALVYKYKPLGVFIQGVSGGLYDVDSWANQEIPNGIAVITENCQFVIAGRDAHDSDCQWYVFDNTTVNNATITSNSNTAANDFDGKEQTAAIIDQLGNNSVNGAIAAYYCNVYRFPNGDTGYLGAAGEWKAVADNISSINDAFDKCGGAFSELLGNYWTSTQCTSSVIWFINLEFNGLGQDRKTSSHPVRAFCSL